MSLGWLRFTGMLDGEEEDVSTPIWGAIYVSVNSAHSIYICSLVPGMVKPISIPTCLRPAYLCHPPLPRQVVALPIWLRHRELFGVLRTVAYFAKYSLIKVGGARGRGVDAVGAMLPLLYICSSACSGRWTIFQPGARQLTRSSRSSGLWGRCPMRVLISYVLAPTFAIRC